MTSQGRGQTEATVADGHRPGYTRPMIMIEELYDALRAANVPDDKARAAAREVAKYTTDNQDIRSELKLHRWMLGFNLALTTAILFKLFS